MLDILYPRRCALCDGVLSVKEEFLCHFCEGGAEFITDDYCMKCGKPVEENAEYCPDCAGKETAFEYGRAVFLYGRQIRESISRFKYHGRQEYAAFYAHAMYQQFQSWIEGIAPDAFVPVPVHKERRRKRGYNQAELVANELGRLCGIQVVSDCLVRIENTVPQKELSGRERYANVNHAFCVRSETQELYKTLKCVIIIDDIYTTGSTMETCAQVLSRYGVRRIYFLCISIGQAV